MHVAIEATLAAQQNPSGHGNYVHHLLENLAMIDGCNRYVLLHSQKKWTGHDYGSNFSTVSYAHWSGSRSAAIRFNLADALNASAVELFHVTCTTGAPPHSPVPVVTTVHDIYPLVNQNLMNIKKRLMFKVMMNWTLNNTAYYIFNSRFTKDTFKQNFPGLDKGTVIHMGSYMEPFSDVPIRSMDTPMVCIGAIEERKQQLFLIDAYAKALQLADGRLPDLHFIGPDRGDAAALRRKISALGLQEKVFYHGYISKAELDDYYRTASLVLYPSSFEGFGIPLVEAMSCAMPIICSDIPVFLEVGGSVPFYCPVGDVDSWAVKIFEFYSGKISYDYSEALKRSGHFGWKDCARKTLDVYAMLTSRHC